VCIVVQFGSAMKQKKYSIQKCKLTRFGLDNSNKNQSAPKNMCFGFFFFWRIFMRFS